MFFNYIKTHTKTSSVFFFLILSRKIGRFYENVRSEF